MPASRSLIALLVGTVVFFALWIVALKPSSSNKSGSSQSQGLGAFQSDINKAHQAVATSNANDAASGNENATPASGGASSSKTTGSSTKPATSPVTKTTTSKPVSKPSASATPTAQNSIAHEVSTVQAAVAHHKVLALLFYNPAAADDQAVEQELASVSTHKGQVVKLSIPLNQAASFTSVTQQVPVNLSPTLVLVSRSGDTDELVGYTDPFTINQLLDNALAAS